MEHNPYCRHDREEDDDDDDDDDDDGPYGQKFARIVSRNITRAGVMYSIN
jgi:hypothetical protein